MNENEQAFTPDFSDIPALGDSQGLENYLNNASLAAQGLPTDTVKPAEAEQPADQGAQQVAQQPAQAVGINTPQLTQEQLAELVRKVDSINAQLNRGQQRSVAGGAQTGGYTPQEQNFISAALQKGYKLSQIEQVIMQRRAQVGGGMNSADMSQRVAAIEQFLRSQQYQQAQDAFISKVSSFGNKWGLSDADLEVFANDALKHGINIAMENVDLEMVFRAVYPEQYAIRSQRMTPTNASQIYGGTSIPDGNRANAARMEDAYVEAFLKGAMPNQYGMLNKK